MSAKQFTSRHGKLRLLFALFAQVPWQAAGKDPYCSEPGVCTPPPWAKFSRVAPVAPRVQWTDGGGYCGALSIQSIALMYGAWISQDLVRGATSDGGGHGNSDDGWEILHTNIEEALQTLKFTYDAWDFQNQAQPQSHAYLSWLKQSLAAGHPVVWMVLCQGDPHDMYGMAAYDHIEPVFGIYSNHSLADGNASIVFDDDVLVHGSDYAPDGAQNKGYFRSFSSLVDTVDMNGNCKDATERDNEMYPCVPDDVDYGYAITGVVDPAGKILPVSLSVQVKNEPNFLYRKAKPANLSGNVTVSGLTAGKRYTLLRWDDYTNVPIDSDYISSNYDFRHDFTAAGPTHLYRDPVTFPSWGATYYRCIPRLASASHIKKHS